jgi:hypothetical protein
MGIADRALAATEFQSRKGQADSCVTVRRGTDSPWRAFLILNLYKSAQSADPLDPVVRGWLRKS